MERVLGYLEFVGHWGQVVEVGELQAREGPETARLAIRKHDVLKLGRNGKECQVIVSDPSISSVHFTIWVTLFDEESFPLFYIRDTSLNGTLVNGLKLEKNVACLLNHQDIIDIWNVSDGTNGIVFDTNYSTPKLRFLSNSAKDELTFSRDVCSNLNIQTQIENWEIIGKIIGNGTFGNVLICQQNKIFHKQKENIMKKNYAVKIIKLKPTKLDKEAKILLKLNHPNIIRVYKTCCDSRDNLYIFQDLIPGGDLFSYLAKGNCLKAIPESESLLIVFQILKALKYLHENGIVHRDLKLDNILLMSPEPCTRIVLADFGIAKTLNTPMKRMHTIVGTPEYCAPEVGFKADRKMYQSFSRAATVDQQRSGYDNKCDLWSLGVVTHIMLTGISPFYGDGTEKSIIRNAKIGNLNFTTTVWNTISNQAKSFVKALLTVDVKLRLDSNEALVQPWILNHKGPLEQIYERKIMNSVNPKNINKHQDVEVSKDVKVDYSWENKIPKFTVEKRKLSHGPKNHLNKKSKH